jgi:hypothetical protein
VSEGPSLPGWIDALRPLAGVVDILVDFANDPTGFVIEIVERYLVTAILTGWRWFLENVVAAFFGAIELGLVEGVAIPLRDGFTAAGSSVYGALEQLRLWAESGLMELGIAAPFALIASWLVLVIIIAVIAQVIYGLLEAYLPTESLTGAVDVLRTAVGGDE